jgi:hypothetical protein
MILTSFDRRRVWLSAALLTSVLLSSGCSGSTPDQAGLQPSPPGHGMQQGEPIKPVQTSDADWKSVADTLDRPGRLSGGAVYRVGFPRSDLTVTSQGIQINPGLVLNSVVGFTRYADGQVLMMGDLVVTEDELQRVTDALHANGISQTAIHKHLLGHQPEVWWTHVHAVGGDQAALARGVRVALEATGTPPATNTAPAPELGIDTAAIDQALGTKGTNQGGLYAFSFVRKETVTDHGRVTVTDHGRVVPAGLGLNTAIGFQPTGNGKAAISGDFCMTAEEVPKVIEALRAGGIQIVALHNHMLSESPHLFFLHFWANDNAVKLAQALRKAVDAQNVNPVG